MLQPNTLWSRMIEQTHYALECGALQPIPTEYELVEDNGIHFLVRILSNLDRKDEARKKQKEKSTTSGKEFNPFLRKEEDLFVADISDTHLCLLNKYNVVDYHLLIITRAFEDQENLLTLQDFEAMWACLAEFDSLVFYNAGKEAGASQRHKHLQLVPLPLVPQGRSIPIEPLITSARFQDAMGTIPGFPFVHAIAKLDGCFRESPLETTLERYHALLQAVGLRDGEGGGNRQSQPYNLLATREWMLVIPRSQESFESISVNSLGFAGALLVRNEQQMKILKEQGIMTILHHVAKNSNFLKCVS